MPRGPRENGHEAGLGAGLYRQDRNLRDTRAEFQSRPGSGAKICPTPAHAVNTTGAGPGWDCFESAGGRVLETGSFEYLLPLLIYLALDFGDLFGRHLPEPPLKRNIFVHGLLPAALGDAKTLSRQPELAVHDFV